MSVMVIDDTKKVNTNTGHWKGRSESQDPEKGRGREMSGYHHQQKHGGRSFRRRILKVITWILGFCFTGYIIAPPLYWHTSEALLSRFSCPPCLCHHCSSHFLPSISHGIPPPPSYLSSIYPHTHTHTLFHSMPCLTLVFQSLFRIQHHFLHRLVFYILYTSTYSLLNFVHVFSSV